MPQTVDINRQIVLAERPKGQPDENTLQMATTEIYTRKIVRQRQMCIRDSIHWKQTSFLQYSNRIQIAQPKEIG